MTEPNDIPAILARATAATQGPWEVGFTYDNKRNAEFIAHSRTDVPNMAAEILSLRAQPEAHPEISTYAPALLGRAEMKNNALRAQLESLRDENQRLIRGHDEYNRANRLLTDENDSLRADKKRLDVLEELSKAGFSVDGISSFMRIAARPWVRFTTLREAADAELSRREKENG